MTMPMPGAMPMPPDPSMGAPAPPPDMGLPLTPPGMGGPSADGLAGGAIAQSTDPNALAALLEATLQQARQAAHSQLDAEQDAAGAQAMQMVHPAVQAMMAPPPAPPMSGTGGGAFPPMAALPSGPMVP